LSHFLIGRAGEKVEDGHRVDEEVAPSIVPRRSADGSRRFPILRYRRAGPGTIRGNRCIQVVSRPWTGGSGMIPIRLLRKYHPGPRIESGAGFDPGCTLDVWCALCTESVDSRPPRRVVDFRGNDKKCPFLWAARFSTDCYGCVRPTRRRRPSGMARPPALCLCRWAQRTSA